MSDPQLAVSGAQMKYRRSAREGHGGKSARSVVSRSSLKLEKIIIRIEKRHCSSMFCSFDESAS